MKQQQAAAVLALLFSAFFWGLSFSSTKVLLGTLLPVQVAFLRLAVAALPLGLAALLSPRRKPSGRDLLRMAAGGATGMFLYFIFENNGLRFTTAGTASLIVAATPALNALAGTIFLKERHPLLRWCGILLSITGVYIIVTAAAHNQPALENLRGNLLVFLAAGTWVLYTRLNVPLLLKYHSFYLTFFQTLTGMALMGALALPQGLDSALFTPVVILNLAYLGVFCSAAAYFLYLYGLKTLGSTTATAFINLVPVFGVLGGAFTLQEVLGTTQLLGGAVVILGISLVTAAGRNSKNRLAAPQN